MTRLSTSRAQAAERTIAVFVLLTVAALLYTRCDVVPARAQETPAAVEGKSAVPAQDASTCAETVAADGGDTAALFTGQRDPARLAMACFGEATGSEADCAAIDSVIQRRAKRAGWTYERMLHTYTSVDRCTRVPTDKEWARALDIARRVISGEIRNSCPGADQFGGLAISTDAHNARKMVHAGKWRLVVCGAKVFNAYFHEVRK